MKPIIIILFILLGLLQYRLWLAPGGINNTIELKQQIALLEKEVQDAQQKNAVLLADVKDLKQGNEAIEERARSELGMIKQGEVFYQIVQ